MPEVRFKDCAVDMSRIENLKDAVSKYTSYLMEDDLENILKAYLLEKPLTFIEIYHAPCTRLSSMIRSLKQFFYVRTVPFETTLGMDIIMSRFKNLVDIATLYPLNDKYADLVGVLVGYSLASIAEYCKKWGLDLIKES